MSKLNEIKVNVEVDQKELKKLVSEMELYPNTKQAIEEYRQVADRLEEREQVLQQQLTELQEKHIKNLLDQDTANVAEVIYLKIKSKKINEEAQIIETLLAETKEEKQELMYHFYRVYRSALAKDSALAGQYNVTPIIDKVLSQTMALIAEVGLEARHQYVEVFPEIDEVFSDSKVREMYPRILDESFSHDRHKPTFSGANVVLEKSDIEKATMGRVPEKFQPKEEK